MSELSLERRIQMLEDRAEIQNLVARYGFLIDDRDMDGVAAVLHRRRRLQLA